MRLTPTSTLLLTVLVLGISSVAQGLDSDWREVMADATREFEYRAIVGAVFLAAEEIDFIAVREQENDGGVAVRMEFVDLVDASRFPDEMLGYGVSFRDVDGGRHSLAAVHWFDHRRDPPGRWDFWITGPAPAYESHDVEGVVDYEGNTITLLLPSGTYPAVRDYEAAGSVIGGNVPSLLDQGVWYHDFIMPGGYRIDTTASAGDPLFELLYHHPSKRQLTN